MPCTTHSSKNRWKKLFKTAFIRLWNEKHFMIIKKVLRVLLIMKNEIRLLTFIINNQWQLKKRKHYSNSNARALLISDYRLYLYFWCLVAFLIWGYDQISTKRCPSLIGGVRLLFKKSYYRPWSTFCVSKHNPNWFSSDNQGGMVDIEVV